MELGLLALHLLDQVTVLPVSPQDFTFEPLLHQGLAEEVLRLIHFSQQVYLLLSLLLLFELGARVLH